MAELYERLKALKESDEYPFHMPGHKRNRAGHPLGEMFGFDITEIAGFDNLHHADGILKRMQDEAAQIYGSRRTFFLVNGSTCGIQAAVTASVRRGRRLLMARNCHKAVYHTCLLRGIETEYVYPSATDILQIFGDVRAAETERMLSSRGDIDAVILTSPNYDGIVSDVETIADIVHAYGAVLIVDEAHGAHLPFSPLFPKSALACGADIVIHSLHKTLPSLTQTALLHVNSERVDADRIQAALSMYQTSSPSYLFMATMQQCIEETQANRETLFCGLSKRIEDFNNACAPLTHIEVLSGDWADRNGIYDFDKSKILILPQRKCLSGEQLYEILIQRYHLQMEMASLCYVMGIATVCDTDEGFRRLADALREIDASLDEVANTQNAARQSAQRAECESARELQNAKRKQCAYEQNRPERVCGMHTAYELPKKKLLLAQAKGAVSGEFAYLYPPGIPLFVPGERITEELLAFLMQCKREGLPLQGLRDHTCETIEVLQNKA